MDVENQLARNQSNSSSSSRRKKASKSRQSTSSSSPKRSRGGPKTASSSTDWQSIGNVSEFEIPEYNSRKKANSASARHSPQRRKINSRMGTTSRGSSSGASSSKRHQHIESSLINPPTAIKTPPSNLLDDIDENNTTSNLTTRLSNHGGITYQNKPGMSDSKLEMKVLESVVLRESYIERIRNLYDERSSSSFSSLMEQVVDLLDWTRIVSVEVIEAILKWKASQKKPHPFIWNGVDYMLRMPSDLDFLDNWTPLSQWLGFSLVRNPFILPGGLDSVHDFGFDEKARRAEVMMASTGGGGGTRIKSAIVKTYVPVGGHAVQVPSTPPSKSATAATATAKKNTPPNPYSTPIINNFKMPRASSSSHHRPATIATTTTNSSSIKVAANASKDSIPFPSQVGDLDILRVREVEKHIAREEDIQGRYKRDPNGRVVPEQLANQRLNLKNLIAEKNCDDDSAIYMSLDIEDRGHTAMGFKNTPSGKTRAYKHAGSLTPITKLGTSGTLRKPLKRSRGAIIEEEILLAKRHNVALAEEIADIREKIDSIGSSLETNEEDFELQEEFEALSKSVSEKERVLATKELEVERKEEAIQAFKSAQKEEVDARRAAKLEEQRKVLNEGEVLEEDEVFAQQIEHHSATQIQRIARGRLAKTHTIYRRIQYNQASTAIQSAYRGHQARSIVCRLYRKKHAAIDIQRIVRGRLARHITLQKRKQMLASDSAIRIQSLVRMRNGKARVAKCRRMQAAAKELVSVSQDDLSKRELEVLSNVCLNASPDNTFPSSLLGLIQIVMLVTSSSSTTNDQPLDSEERFSWLAAAKYLRRSEQLLRRLRAISAFSGTRYVVISPLARNLLTAYAHEPTFMEDTFMGLQNGRPAALGFYRWVTSLATVLSVQDDFLTKPSASDVNPFEETREMVEQDRVSNEEHSITEARIERQFISSDLLKQYTRRSRPVVLLVSRDLPRDSKKRIIKCLTDALPGMFLRIDDERGAGDIKAIQNILDVGYSAIVDTDIGLCEASRRSFIQNFTAMKAALRPTPLCLLIKGDVGNRIDNSGFYGVDRRDIGLMTDGDVKRKLELAAAAQYDIADGSLFAEMTSISEEINPLHSIVHVMEAVLILFSPHQEFRDPSETTLSVSWQILKPLLQIPEDFVRKINAVKYNEVPISHREVLRKYIDSPSWPSVTVQQSHGSLLLKVCQWVESVVSYVELVASKGGLAPDISRRNPSGVFAGVITQLDSHTTAEQLQEASIITTTTTKDNDEEEENRLVAPASTRTFFSEIESNAEAGWQQAACKLLASILEDVRVHRESTQIGTKHVTINLYRDCQQIFFSAYNPATSLQQYTVIHESAVNPLLTPNSSEIGKDSKASRVPPSTPKEMYSRLVQLCSFHNVKPSATKLVTHDGPLRICRKELSLCRESRKICGNFATVSISELSQGDIIVHAFIQSTCQELSLRISKPQMQELILDSVGEEREAFESEIGTAMVSPIMDRLTLYHPKRNRAYRRNIGGSNALPEVEVSKDICLGIRTKGGAGRLVYQQVLKRSYNAKGIPSDPVVLTIYEVGVRGSLRIKVYQTSSCKSGSTSLTSRERIDVLGSTGPDVQSWIGEMLKRLVVKKNDDGDTLHVKFNRHIHNYYVSLPYEDDVINLKSEKPIKCLVKIGSSDAYGALDFTFYKSESSEQYKITLTDAQLGFVAKKQSLPWPPETQGHIIPVIKSAMYTCRWSARDEDVVFYDEVANIRVTSNNPRRTTTTTVTTTSETPIFKATDAAAELTDKYKVLFGATVRSVNNMLITVTLHYRKSKRPVIIKGKPGFPDRTEDVDDFELRFVVYKPETSASAECLIDGLDDLREVVGPHHQELCDVLNRAPELVRHIALSRLVLMDSNESMSAMLIRNKLFGVDKVTPINAALDADTEAQKDVLLRSPAARGKKLLSKALTINTLSLIVTVFDTSSLGQMPSFRIVGYDTASSVKMVLSVSIPQVIELLNGEELLDRREFASTTLLPKLVIEQRVGEDPRLALAPFAHLPVTLQKTYKRSRKQQVYHGARTCDDNLSVICTVYHVQDVLLLHVYEPSGSISSQVVVNQEKLSTLLGIDSLDIILQSDVHILRGSMHDLCELLEVKVVQNEDKKSEASLKISFDTSEQHIHDMQNSTLLRQMDHHYKEEAIAKATQDLEELELTEEDDEPRSAEDHVVKKEEEVVVKEAAVIGGKYCMLQILKILTTGGTTVVPVTYKLRAFCPSAQQVADVTLDFTISYFKITEDEREDARTLRECLQEAIPHLVLENAFPPQEHFLNPMTLSINHSN